MNSNDRDIWQRSEPVEIAILSDLDSCGRQTYRTTWLADNIGPRSNERGRRGQVSHASVADDVAYWEARGFEVAVIDEEATR